MHGDAVRGLVETDEVAVEVIGTFRLDPAREVLQAVPGSDDLGEVVPAHDVAEAVEQNPVVDMDPEVRDPRAALREDVQQFLVADDAGAAALQLDVRSFVYVYLPALLPEEARCEEAGNGSADNDRPSGHVSTPASGLFPN